MSIPTDEEIGRWRARWEKYPNLPGKIADILKTKLDETNSVSIVPGFNFPNFTLRDAQEILETEGKGDFDAQLHGFCDPKFGRYGEEMHDIGGITLDLRGIPWKEFDLSGATLWSVCLNGSNMSGVNLNDALIFNSELNRADLSSVQFKNVTCITSSMAASDIRYARLDGAKFDSVTFTGSNLSLSTYVEDPPKFSFIDFIPTYSELTGWKLSNWQWLKTGWKFWQWEWYQMRRLFFQRWYFTHCHDVQIEGTITSSAADFRRYVEDQRFVKAIHDKSPIAYWIWNLTTACGWSTVRLMFWAILVIIGFACLYANFGLVTPPDLVTHPIAEPVIPSIGPALDTLQQVFLKEMPNVSPEFQWFYVSFDIFTNLGIRVTTKPASNWGVVVMFIETVLGWMTLGLALTVFANKYARRS